MYELAKSAREKLKAKARSMAAAPSLAKGQDTTSATWSPAEALNADAKTGARPVGKARLYKKGGKVASGKAAVRADRKPRKAGGRVETEIGIGMSNKDVRTANEKREGVKHVGGFKKGGATKDAGVKEKKALGAIDPSPKRGAAGHYKKGGRIKKEGGGYLADILARVQNPFGQKAAAPAKAPAITAADLPPEIAVPARSARQSFVSALPAAAQRAVSEFSRKKGGKVKKADGGSLPSPEEAIGSEERLKGIKAMPTKSATPAAQVTPQQLRREEGYSEADRKATRKAGGRAGRADGGGKIDDRMNQAMNAMGKVDTSGYKQVQPYKEPKNPQPAEFELSQLHNRGGRAKRATGGPAISMPGLKGIGKKASKKGGKTDINIVINAGKPMPHNLAAGMPQPGAGPAMPMPPGAGAPPPAMPPMPMPPPGAGPMPPAPGGFKKGGRVGKFYGGQMQLGAPTQMGAGQMQLGAPTQMGAGQMQLGAPAQMGGGQMRQPPMGGGQMGQSPATAGSGMLPGLMGTFPSYLLNYLQGLSPFFPHSGPSQSMATTSQGAGQIDPHMISGQTMPSGQMPHPMGAGQMPTLGQMGRPSMGAGQMSPLGRKDGGRITKVASSYKDMEAGAASGEGRLQKTDIAKHHKDAPARKAGGRISKVAKSYKDMTAGAGSGEGRFQKTDIAKAKIGRGK